MLRLASLRKRFGGVAASDGVTLEVARGEVHALIGPNGAGKTTLIHQIAGSLRPDSGEIWFRDRPITGESEHARVRAGLARSFQVTSLFPGLSVLDNLALAVQARSGSSFSFWKPLRRDTPMFDEAAALAAEVGLSARVGQKASGLAHGEQRALEVGLALATQPSLLLLDEPMAGLGPDESAKMVALIERVAARVTILLVEHDMDAVFRLARRISVLVSGRIVASGAPDAIRADAEVRKAYLGDA